MSTRRSEVEACAAWLREHFATPYPVRIKWVPHLKQEDPKISARERATGIFACTERKGRVFVISLSLRANRTIAQAVDSLLHEWAHCATWRHERVERKRQFDHDDTFALVYWRAYRGWIDEEPTPQEVKGAP